MFSAKFRFCRRILSYVKCTPTQKSLLHFLKVTVYLQGWLHFNGCSASRLHHRYPKPYQVKAYRTGYPNISLLFQENKFLIFSQCRNLKARFVFLEFQLNAIFIFWNFFFFSRSGSQRLKKRVGFSLIRLRSKVTEHF